MGLPSTKANQSTAKSIVLQESVKGVPNHKKGNNNSVGLKFLLNAL